MILIPTLLSLLFQAPSHRIIFQISNSDKKPVAAKVRLYSKAKLLKEYTTSGAFDVTLPEGDYVVEAMRCDTTQLAFKADRKKMVWLVVKDKCAQ